MPTRNAAPKNEKRSEGYGQGQSRQGGRGGQHEEGYLARGNEQIRELVTDHEGQAVLTALALGFGIGLMIGYAMGPSEPEHRWSDRLTAEGLGRRLLHHMDRLLPDALTSRLNG
jgi:hypothetical protein